MMMAADDALVFETLKTGTLCAILFVLVLVSLCVTKCLVLLLKSLVYIAVMGFPLDKLSPWRPPPPYQLWCNLPGLITVMFILIMFPDYQNKP